MGDFPAWHRLELAERGVRSPAFIFLDQFASAMVGIALSGTVPPPAPPVT